MENQMPQESFGALTQFKQFLRSPLFRIAAILIVVAAVPLTVFVAQQQQDIRQRASELSEDDLIFATPSPSPTPTSVPSPVNGSISGSTTGTVGQRLVYSAQGDSQPAGAKFVTMHVAKTTADLTVAGSWTKIGEAFGGCDPSYAAGLPYCSAEGSFTPTEAGTYYVTAVVVPNSGSPCSGNPRYNALPGWLDCDSTPNDSTTDAITLTVTAPSPTPTGVLTPTPTTTPGAGTLFDFTINLAGVGERGNENPRTSQKQLQLELFDAGGTAIATTTGQIEYDTQSKNFQGSVGAGTDLTAGNYTLKVKTGKYLKKLIPGIQTISSSRTTPYVILPITLSVGDANDDNQLDIEDYNMLLSCFGDKANTSSCINKDSVDFDDNGVIDGVDYNLFIRSLSVKEGD